jgi:short-subunit dehydrogenase
MYASPCGLPANVAAPSFPYRTAFVTGASAGLGQGFVRMLLAEGVKVWGTARETDRLAEFAGQSGFVAVALDLSQPEHAAAAFSRADEEAGGFDVVINNAGYGVFGPFDVTDFHVWQSQVDALLTTTARIAHLALRSMRARGRGSLVNVASLATEFPLPYMAGYNMAKAGLSALSESLMVETAGTGVTVLDFRPGDYRTGFNHTMQSHSIDPVRDPRLARAWKALEANLSSSPEPERAAVDLRRALLRRQSGVVRSGSWFQAWLAPLLARLAPLALKRTVMARYYGVS